MEPSHIPEQTKRPTVQEMYDVLKKYNALIVHFSGAPKGAGASRNNNLYPNDLQHAINGHAQGGLSCSTVIPRDNFQGLYRNATGCIGIVLGLKGKESLSGAYPKDCGSNEDEKNKRLSFIQNELAITDIENTITNRPFGNYNEWIIKDYNVLGIFAVSPFEIAFLESPASPPGMPDRLKPDGPVASITSTTPEEVCDQFKGLPIYGFHEKTLCKWVNGHPQSCTHDDIYQLP